MIPLLSNFPYSLSDCKFFSAPVDYIVFDGMSQYRDTGAGEITIIFADVKSGEARLSKVQNQIKKSIQEGKIRFETWKIKDGQYEKSEK